MIDPDVREMLAALEKLKPTKRELMGMMAYLCGYSPRGVDHAIAMVAAERKVVRARRAGTQHNHPTG